MSLQITQLLLSAQSADAHSRTAAEENLKQFHDKSFTHFLLSLSVELSDDQKPLESRKLAGIILKNTLDAKDVVRKRELHQQWVNLDASIKDQIKELLLQTLRSPVSEASHTASQAIAKVASIEIPRKGWQDLIERLLVNMTQLDTPVTVRQATLHSLGYVCEEISPQDLEQKQVNAVLTAVVNGMTLPLGSDKVRLAAVRALYNALGFAQTNFENELERNFIMKVLCETAVSKELEIRQAAFECLVSVASMYYEFLDPFMEKLFSLTANAVKGDEESVALQAVEFWSSICDAEIQIQEEYEGSDDGSSNGHWHFIQRALHALVPMLLETILRQLEDQDQDDSAWNISMAGGTCLGLVAKTVGDEILGLVLPFVESNITKPDWRSREAATFAFGSILEGPSVEKLSPIVHSGLDFLLNAMKDENNHVKDTTAWTLGRIFEILHSSNSAYPVVTTSNFQRIISVLLDGFLDAPNVADKVCGAVYFLAQGYEDTESDSSVLTPYLVELISALLFTADRTDVCFFKLRSSAYETLNELVRCCQIPETSNMIARLLNEIMTRLGGNVECKMLSSDEIEKQSDLQALLCGVLQVIIQKLCSSNDTKSIILQAADQIMSLLLSVLACRSFTVHEEAMLAVGALAYATGQTFIKYMPELYKYLEMGLQNHEEYQVCSISVGVIGDICRALDDKVLPYCDGLMSILLKNQSNPMLHQSVKPPIFSCFGDIALAIGENFEKYVPYVMSMLQGASQHCANLDNVDEDMLEYRNQLRRGIFEAYSGILQGSKSSKAELMVPYAKHLLQFTDAVVRDANRDDAVTKAAVAVIGDLADALGPNVKVLLKDAYFPLDFLEECFNSEDAQLNETATWTRGMLGRVLAS
ncbi:hypothetical protein HPP92_024840 [Vanilla planifolia]|uniref:Importin N-terminal domain-containing protein n=1 Tax=Vanilla planifolia TaxID=51239 RepID=A0A835UBR6_VANPL|nr:hypothetical protein HPP92_024840 [Vanilla planifolia]